MPIVEQSLSQIFAKVRNSEYYFLGIIVTRYEPSSRLKIAKLQENLWTGGTAGNLAYLDWKYDLNPYLRDKFISLAWSGDRLIGMVGAFGALWEDKEGQNSMLPCLSDTVVEPEFRGQPIFVDMLSHLKETLEGSAVSWLLNFGDQPSTPALLLRGWKKVETWGFADRYSDTDLPEVGTPEITGKIEPDPDFEELADLASRQPFGGRLRHVRSAAYLRWRNKNPLGELTYFTVRDDQKLVGFMTVHRVTSGTAHLSPLTVVDHAAIDNETWQRLINTVVGGFPRSWLRISTRELSQKQISILKALRFTVQTPTNRVTKDTNFPHLLVAQVDKTPSLDGLSNSEAWDLGSICGRSWR